MKDTTKSHATQKVNKQIVDSIVNNKDDAGLLSLTKEVSLLTDRITELEAFLKNFLDEKIRANDDNDNVVSSATNEQFLSIFEKIDNIEKLLGTFGNIPTTSSDGEVIENLGLIKDEIIDTVVSIENSIKQYNAELSSSVIGQMKSLAEGLNNLEFIIKQPENLDDKLGDLITKQIKIVQNTILEQTNNIISECKNTYTKAEDEGYKKEKIEDVAIDNKEEKKYEEKREYEDIKGDFVDMGMKEDTDEEVSDKKQNEDIIKEEAVSDNKEENSLAEVGEEAIEEESKESGEEKYENVEMENKAEETIAEDKEERNTEGEEEDIFEGEKNNKEEGSSKSNIDAFFESDDHGSDSNKKDGNDFFTSNTDGKKGNSSEKNNDDFFGSGENNKEKNSEEVGDEFFGENNDKNSEKGNDNKKSENDFFEDVNTDKTVKEDIKKEIISDDNNKEDDVAKNESEMIVDNFSNNQDFGYEAVIPPMQEVDKISGFGTESDIPPISFEDFLVSGEKNNDPKDSFWGNNPSPTTEPATTAESTTTTTEVVGSDEVLKDKIRALKERINEEKTE
ncbi:MAG: hypothetical protein LBG48_02480 [Rickettsiales bacterium]|nr:hypothetical protein [Rickettsiales bacterium]